MASISDHGEIGGEAELDERQRGLEGAVTAGAPRLVLPHDAVLGRAREIAGVIEERLEDGAGVIDGEADAEGEEQGQQEDFLHPGARIEDALGADVEDAGGEGGGDEDRDIEQDGAPHAAAEAAADGVQEDAEEGEEQVGEVRGEMGGGLELDEQRADRRARWRGEVSCRSGWSPWSSGAAGI